MQATASALVPAALATSKAEARRVTTRLMRWSGATGLAVCTAQLAALPLVLPLFTPVAAVREAAAAPAVAAALVQLVNSACYTAEGVAMGLSAWGPLTAVTSAALALFLAALSLSTRVGGGLVGIWASVGVLNLAILLGLAWYITQPGGALADRADDAT
jgi:Na+-driven multidrug efflux pump